VCPDHSVYPVEEHTNWMELYPDAEEENLNYLPTSKGPKSIMLLHIIEYARLWQQR
jgi:hypothetical protein